MKIKLTLKYSSFFFTNDVCLAKNVTQEIDTDKLSNKDFIFEYFTKTSSNSFGAGVNNPRYLNVSLNTSSIFKVMSEK